MIYKCAIFIEIKSAYSAVYVCLVAFRIPEHKKSVTAYCHVGGVSGALKISLIEVL